MQIIDPILQKGWDKSINLLEKAYAGEVKYEYHFVAPTLIIERGLLEKIM